MNFPKHLLVMSISLALVACGGGGSGGSDDGGDNPQSGGNNGGGGGGSTPPEEVVASLCDADYSAIDIDGDVVGGTASAIREGLVEVEAFSSGSWSSVTTATTNANGQFALSSFTDVSGPVRFTISGNANTELRCESATGCGDVEAGDYYPMPEGYVLSAIVDGDDLAASGQVAITPVTHMSAQWAADMPQGLTSQAIELSDARIQKLFGLADDYSTSLPLEIADCGATASASAEVQNHALVSAGFSELADDEGYGLDLIVEGGAYMYSLLGGQVLTGSSAVSKADIRLLLAGYPQYSDLANDLLAELPFDDLSLAGLDKLITSAKTVVDGLQEGEALSSGAAASVKTRLDGVVSVWGDRMLTNLVESTSYDADDFAQGVALLDEYAGYRQDAQDAEAGIDAANRNLGWLYIDDAAMTNTEGMLTILSEVIGYGIEGSVCAPILTAGYDCELESSYASIVEISDNTYEVQANGTSQGQNVNLTVGVEDIRELLASDRPDHTIAFTIQGTISNPTATTSVDTTIEVDLSGNTNFDEFREYNQLVSWYWDYSNGSLETALNNLAANLWINLGITGSIEISKTSDSSFSYAIENLDSLLHLNLQDENAPVLTYRTLSTTTNPQGETKGPIGGGNMFDLVVDDPLTLQTAYRFENLGLPPMEVEAGGELVGYGEIVTSLTDYIEQLLADNPDPATIDYDQVYAELEALFGGMNLSSLALNGDNELRIFNEAGDTEVKTYSFSTQADGGVNISESGTTAATLYVSGVAGYVYVNNTLVAIANFGDEDEGLLISRVDGTQEAYQSQETQGQDELLTATWTLLESLFGNLFSGEETTP